ncbi:TonB-dependent receptor [Dyella amyloliquefaciens]|uniref:TonB-dependent receptor n=1 Tax=Dyella amyloliquefaciens TaxID=1770545 RepID=UPI00102E5A08|nr:TonB-dependent receptor [Dyella amyloliquefaciens]
MNKLKLKHLAVELGRACRPGRDRVMLAVGASFLVGSLMSSTVYAQAAQPAGNASAQDAGQSGGDSKKATTLSTVTVTAQKRSEALLDVPVPVAVVQPTNLVINNTLQLSDYYTQVPGLSYSRGNVAIRGITTGTFGNPTVGVTIDDVPFGSTVANGTGGRVVPDFDPFALQQIEVLRGPQGTLYGAASMGGLIKYETVSPQTNSFGGRVEVDGQNIDHGGTGWGVRGSVNVPLTNNLAVLVSAFERDEPGYIQNTQNDNDKGSKGANGGRISALWLPADNVTVRVSALQQHTYTDNVSNFAGDINRVPTYGDDYSGKQLPNIYDHRDTKFYDAHVDVDFGWGSLTSLTGYSQDSFTHMDDVSPIFGTIAGMVFGVPGLGANIYEPGKTDKFSQEFRLSSNEGNNSKWDWQAGAFFTRENSFSAQSVNPLVPSTMEVVGPPGEFFNSSGPSTYKEYALYGDVSYHFTDRFDVQVGGRVSRIEQTYESLSGGILNGGDSSVSGSSSDHNTTYLITPRYKLTDDVMVYGRVATGYRPGGSNAGVIQTSDVPLTYAPDKTTNYELGIKGAYFDHQLVWDASVYYIAWNHVQILETSLVSGMSFTGNAGKAKSQGVENTLTFQPTESFSITGNLVYNDAVLTQDFPLESAYALSGDRLPYSAKWTGSLSFDKNFPVAAGWTGFTGATFSYVGDRYEDFPSHETFPRVHVPSYSQTDIHGGVMNGPWTFALNVRNLFDRRGYLGGGPKNTLSPVDPRYSWNMIQPRTIGLTAAYKF